MTNETQTGKFYTAARKVPQLIGVTPSGERIPGGPYTTEQFALGLIALVVGFFTRPLWGNGDTISEVIIIAAVAAGVLYGAGKLPHSRRSLINAINCWIGLITRPRTGKFRGRKIPASYSKIKPKKHASQAVSAAAAEQEDATAPAPKTAHINSGLDRLTADLTTAH